jgi:hypothetical protein
MERNVTVPARRDRVTSESSRLAPSPRRPGAHVRVLLVVAWVPLVALAAEPRGPSGSVPDAGMKAPSAPRLVVREGLQKAIQVPGLKRARSAEPRVCDVKVLGNDFLLFIGYAAGHTTVEVWTEGPVPVTYDVEISPAPR